MQNRIADNRLPESSSYRLVTSLSHDTRGITPLHVTVIEAVAGVIGVDPTKHSLRLADYVSISAIDSLSKDHDDCPDEHSVVSFFYPSDDGDLLVVAKCDGDVMVYENR